MSAWLFFEQGLPDAFVARIRRRTEEIRHPIRLGTGDNSSSNSSWHRREFVIQVVVAPEPILHPFRRGFACRGLGMLTWPSLPGVS